jgi:GSH-dependent disulfide-bond oxidoreductase
MALAARRKAQSKRASDKGRPKTKSSARKAAKRAAKKAAEKAAKRAPPRRTAKAIKSIALWYWPTPNGFKVSIMLEECRLPYTMIPVNLAKGEQFNPDFLKIAPNNRMPAIVDPQGPGGRPISIFESGAILQYLGRKTGRFYPKDERGRVEVDQWLFWQMGGLGPMAGQLNHFKRYAREALPYAIKRYEDEVNRLYGVMNTRLADREFLAGRYSIADMACVGWVNLWKVQDQTIDDFPHLKRWLQTVKARPAVQRGMALGKALREGVDMKSADVQAVLFGQRAR